MHFALVSAKTEVWRYFLPQISEWRISPCHRYSRLSYYCPMHKTSGSDSGNGSDNGIIVVTISSRLLSINSWKGQRRLWGNCHCNIVGGSALEPVHFQLDHMDFYYCQSLLLRRNYLPGPLLKYLRTSWSEHMQLEDYQCMRLFPTTNMNISTIVAWATRYSISSFSYWKMQTTWKYTTMHNI